MKTNASRNDTVILPDEGEITIQTEDGHELKLSARKVVLLYDLIGNGRTKEMLCNLQSGMLNVCAFKLAYDENDNLPLEKEIIIEYTLLINFFKIWVKEEGNQET